LVIEQEIGDRRGEGYGLTYLGHALAGPGELKAAAKAYGKALYLRRELGQHGLAVDDLTGLAHTAMVQEDSERALEHVEEILAWIEANGTEEIEYPLQVYLTCYRVLRASQDSRAGDILNTAHRLLQERAAKISDEEMRCSFLENVATHREILSEFAKGE